MIGRFAVVASISADAIAFYTLAEWLASPHKGADERAVGAWAFLLVALAAFGLPRLFTWYGLDGRMAYAITVVTALVLMYAIIRLEVAGNLWLGDLAWATDFLTVAARSTTTGGRVLFAALLLGATWLRVSYRAADDVEMEMVPRSVGWGFVLVTALVVLAASSDRSAEVARAGAAFYAVAIVALACSQLSLSGVTFGEGRAGSVVYALFAGTIAVTLVGLLVFGALFAVLAPVLGPIIGAVVEAVLTVLLTPVAWLLTRIFEAMFGDTNPFANLTSNAVTQAEEARDPESGSTPLWQQWMTYLLRGIALAVILGVAAGAVALFTRFRRRSDSVTDDDATMSIVGSAGDDIREFFRSLFPRRQSKVPPYASTAAAQLYLDVLEQAERDGAARPEGHTAAEFQPTLASHYRADVTESITRAFEQARYAGREPDARTIEDLRRRWRTVR